jgi:hypothetical protein
MVGRRNERRRRVRVRRGQASVPPHEDEVVVSLSPDREEPRPELEQLRRWFEARGGRLGTLLETEPWSPNGGGEGVVAVTQPPPVPAQGPRKARGWLKAGLMAISAAVILAGGAWFGQTWRSQAPERSSVQTPAASPVTRTVTRTVAPASCLTALRQGDAAIRLLSRDVRDRRLDKAITAYQRSREDCRKQSASR